VCRKKLPEDYHFLPSHPAMKARAQSMADAPSASPPAPWGLAPRPQKVVPVVHSERGIGNTAEFGEHLDGSAVNDTIAAQRTQYATLMLLLFCPFSAKDDLKCGLDTWDPWPCFLHAKATGALRAFAAQYLKHTQLFHVRFLRRHGDLVPLPGVARPARQQDDGGDANGVDGAATARDEVAFAELHARADAAGSAYQPTGSTTLMAGRANGDTYADPAATAASVKRNRVFAERQDAALADATTRDRLLRASTLTTTLLCPPGAVRQHLADVDRWGRMLAGEPVDDSQPSPSPSPSPSCSDTSGRRSDAAWTRRVRVELAHCFQHGATAGAQPEPGTDAGTHLLCINAVRA